MSDSDGSAMATGLIWVIRACWVLVGALGSEALDEALRSAPGTAPTAGLAMAGAAWLAGVGGLAVLSTPGLTVVRAVVPLSVPGAIAVVANEVTAASVTVLVAATVATIGVCSAEFGNRCVQMSAYGDEHRFTLRPPAGYLTAAVIAWAMWAIATVVAVLALGRQHWPVGLVALVIWVALGALAAPRWHLLARRWLVMVPAGLVVHDRLVLAETLMLKRSEIDHLGLAPAHSDAVDLTGPAAGHAVEIGARAPMTVIMAPPRRGAPAQPLETLGVLVSPSRPGTALRRALAHRIPVGSGAPG